MPSTEDINVNKKQDNAGGQDAEATLDRASMRQKHLEGVVEAPVVRYMDTVWQQQPPRLLKYRPSHLHAYGWIPFFPLKNISATFLSGTTFQVQAVLLVGWMSVLHWTGLGIPEDDLKSFSLVFGTPYLGAIFNGCMLVTFLLGMFASLVIQRWWSIRQAYAKISSTTVDLALIISNTVKPYLSKQRATAAVELIRLLNLGHILMLQSADQQSQDFRSTNFIKRYFQPQRLCTADSETDMDPGLFRRRFKYMDYQDLRAEGLINRDEYQKIKQQSKLGLEPHVVVYYWIQALAARCQAKGLIPNGATITAKSGAIVEAANSIFTFIRTQMPYPYVHLVSCMAHAYLIFIATYVGLFLHIGFPGDRNTKTVSGLDDFERIDEAIDSGLQNFSFETAAFGLTQFLEIKLKKQVFTAVVLYIVVVAMNFVLQGMLDMHSLLDNPFGEHVTKFPLRNQIKEVMNATRAIISWSNEFPLVFQDVVGEDEEPVDDLGIENKQQNL